MTEKEMLSTLNEYKQSGRTGDCFNEHGEKCGIFKVTADSLQIFCGGGAAPSSFTGGITQNK